MALTAAGGLNHTPYSLIRTGLQPGFCKLIALLHHVPGMGISVPIYGDGNIENHIGLDVLRNQINDFLWIGSVPSLDMYDPHGVFGITGAAHLACRLCYKRDGSLRFSVLIFHDVGFAKAPNASTPLTAAAKSRLPCTKFMLHPPFCFMFLDFL